ncbi:MAG: bifunctional (p)ppGpp synthetase/guanosine-3',5'-bis(diphosphate) 3'-pyrophosphohydrolase [Clostridia bacterium]|nr:bifunctional (p)ppGpp synthetase/guanosine-3',5'-bis(diphosphate) 3'-pyrophosphohydrolase [Clostridia bacterium]
MLLHKAIEYAAVKHRNQYRKGTDVPYIVHPMEVLQILTAMGCSIETQIAGVLHDTVEDTDTTIQDIEALFGGEVAELVKSDTEDKSLNWTARKEKALCALKTHDLGARQLLLADKLSNIKSVYNDLRIVGANVWSRFKGSPSQTEWYYREIIAELSKDLSQEPAFQELEKYVNLVFAEKFE